MRGRRLAVRLLSPTYTVGAVCLIERSDGCVLLVRHSYRRRWGTPGGLLRRHESAEAAAKREVLEEVGIDVELVGAPSVVVAAESHRIDIVFRAQPVSETDARDEVVPRSVEIVEARWFPPDELPELQHETTGALVALARGAATRMRVAG